MAYLCFRNLESYIAEATTAGVPNVQTLELMTHDSFVTRTKK